MNRGVYIWIGLILVLIVGVAIIEAGVRRPINWQKTYNLHDKIPFGLYVFRQELPHILGDKYEVTDFGDTFYEEIENLDSLDFDKCAFVEIDEYSMPDEESIKRMLDYTSKGGEVFIAATYHNDFLMDTLGVYEERLDYERFLPNEERVFYTLGRDTAQIKVDKIAEFRIFSKVNAANTTVLGHLHSRGRALPNFIRVAVGKGFVYLHTMPEVFANYHILEEDKYNYVSKVIGVLQNPHIMFSDLYYVWEQPQTPLRVILTMPGFYQAWYLLLFGLLILLVFKSKREQRFVEVVRPEPNLSKDFAQTIGNLYYENGSPGNIIHKKIEYFLYQLRASYQVETMDLQGEKLSQQLSSKSGVPAAEIAVLLSVLRQYRAMPHHRTDDVIYINGVIEEFKQKANLI